MANTKNRKQFNCYIKDDYIVRLRALSEQQVKPLGETVETMLDAFTAQDLRPLIVRVSELVHQGVSEEQRHQLRQLLSVL